MGGEVTLLIRTARYQANPGPGILRTVRRTWSRGTATRAKAPRKPENSVVLPHVDVRAGVGAINLGQAERVGNDFKINGRMYGMESNGTLFPRSGDGIVQMDRGSYWALQTMIQFGDDPERLALQMTRQGIGQTEQSLAAGVFKLHRKG